MKIDYIIIQAGGKGTRLFPLTQNRPKALVPINNRPIIFHLFEHFSEAEFIIIGDYKYKILKSYLDTFAKVRFLGVHADGEGNAAGVQNALSLIPNGKSFMLLWSDLLLDDMLDFKALKNGNYVGITNNFPCSWIFQNNIFTKKLSDKKGVGGVFLFTEKKILSSLPQKGSFVQWLKDQDINLDAFDLLDTKELGTIEALENVDNSRQNRCRPYNKMSFDDKKVKKEGLTSEGKDLIKREVAWYKAVSEAGFNAIPKIYSFSPLVMELIHGENIFKAKLNDEKKKMVLSKLVAALNELHNIGKTASNTFDIQYDYYTKTLKRLYSIRSSIPFADDPFIKINGKKCKNILVSPHDLQTMVDSIINDSVDFGIIHGDGTLTNTMIDEKGKIYFIDARGYFGKTPLIGDVYYDWAKLYYSVMGSFDQFNIKNFELLISDTEISYKIASSGWEHLTDYMLSLIPNCNLFRLKLIHAIIWLSLASHCWEDYDSMCLAFYNGLYLLNELM